MSFITCIVMHRAPPNYETRRVHRERICGEKRQKKRRRNGFLKSLLNEVGVLSSCMILGNLYAVKPLKFQYLCVNICLTFQTEVWLIYKVLLISAVEQHNSVIPRYTLFSIFFSIMFYH